MNIFNYLLFRLYEHFSKSDKSFLLVNISIFLIACQCSFFLFIYFIGSLIYDFSNIRLFVTTHRENKFFIIVPIALVLFVLNYVYLSKKEYLGIFNEWEKKYKRDKYWLPMWIIFSIPIMITLVAVLAPGIVNGTAKFPLFENLFR